MSDLDWKESAINKIKHPKLRRDVITYCDLCDTRTNFQIDYCGYGRHRYRCHNCGGSFSRTLIFPMPRDMKTR